MSKLIRMLVLVPIVIVGFLFFEELLFWGPARRAQARIEKADKTAIVKACRQIMVEWSTYTNENEEALWAKDSIWVKHGSMQYETRFPDPIRSLNPCWVLISTNEVLLMVRPFPNRVYLHAFAEGATQRGARQLADGLWY